MVDDVQERNCMDKLTFLQGPYSFVLLALDTEVFCKKEATPEQVLHWD